MLMNNGVFDWTKFLAERMYEFMSLQYKTFYMLHYAIGLFLDATWMQISTDRLEVRPSPFAPDDVQSCIGGIWIRQQDRRPL